MSILTCSTSFCIHPVPDGVYWPLFAAPQLDKHVALAKHAVLRVAAAVLSVPSDVFTTPPMIESPPKSYFEHSHRDLVSQVLTDSWNATRALIEMPPVSMNEITEAHDGQDPSTYGEVTELGSRQLFHYMHMKEGSKEDIVFVDLGSGQGKLVVQAFLEIPRLRSAVGVELVQNRYDIAVGAWNKIQGRAHDVRATLREQSSVYNEASVQFHHGDLFAMDVTIATHVYVASLCFSNDMMERLADKLVKEANSLKCIATLRPFPKRRDWRFGRPIVEYVEMSWTKPRGEGCVVYFYEPSTY